MTPQTINKFKGTGVAIVTPFHREGSIDFKSFESLIEYQIKGGVEYIVFMGTTGESVTLNSDEKNAIIHFGLEIVDNRVPVVIGIGGNNTRQIISDINHTDFTGISAILSVSPYYNKPQPKGIFNHYRAIASECPVPLIMYNVPGRTSSNIDAETTLRIAHELPNVIAVKEASGNLAQCSRIISGKPENFLVISGDDALTLPFMAIGGDGVISVIANAFPAEFSDMVRYCLENNYEKAREIHFKLFDIIETIYSDGSPSGVKALLEIKGLAKNNLRLPLVKVNKAVYNQLSTLNEEFMKG
ncbi:MAG: 4-hydroxy-tetrahydrodipicolinate synthase [Bacteroidetes bacterium]|nr:MAG: 4-hydroxy-tetrahydrodipicolinate synthase [Bacteroidota bacterium]